MEAVLPPSLTRLDVGGQLQRVVGATGLRDVALTHLVMGRSEADPDSCNLPLLLFLSSLAAPWRLKVVCDTSRCTRDELRQAAAAIGAAKGLTCLHLEDDASEVPQQPAGLGWCAALSGLPRLHALDLWGGAGGLLRLTALTSLRYLLLEGVDAAADGTVTALSASMTGLQQLYVDCMLGAVCNRAAHKPPPP
jgi:hypothetical protein